MQSCLANVAETLKKDQIHYCKMKINNKAIIRNQNNET